MAYIRTKIRTTKLFEKNLRSIRDKKTIEKLKKQIIKIQENPDIGKPLRYLHKGERTIYVKPYRLIYSVDGDIVYLLKFDHRKHVYR